VAPCVMSLRRAVAARDRLASGRRQARKPDPSLPRCRRNTACYPPGPCRANRPARRRPGACSLAGKTSRHPR
jgi:hypothetical protein